MSLQNYLYEYYYEMTINELKLSNTKRHHENITYNSIMYLDIISYTKNCTVSHLAELLNISKSAVTIKVNELISQGLVIKTTSKIDKRINYLTVNAVMIEEYEAYDKILHDTIKNIENKYTFEEIEKFCDMLSMINAGYKKGVND